MKKLLFAIFILISSLISAQTVSNIGGQVPQDDNYRGGVVQIQKNSDGTFSLGHYTYSAPNDTLTGIDSVIYNYGNRPWGGYFQVRNIKSDSDSIEVYYLDIVNNRWTSQMSGIADMLDPFTPLSDNTLIIVPGNTTKRYKILDQYPAQVKIKVKGTTGQNQDTLYISFIEKN